MTQTPEERMQQLRLLKPIRNHPLTQQSYQELMKKLQDDYGNTHTELQRAALKNMLNAFTQTAIGNMRGRHGYPLPCGLGKTTGIITWVSELYKLRYEHISVVICCSKVEALADIKQALMDDGVPEKEIGLLHTYPCDKAKAKAGVSGYASLPATKDNDNRPYLLATHNRVRNKRTTDEEKVEQVYTYRGRKRNLVIYDETLFSSDSTSMPLSEIEIGLDYLKKQATEENQQEAVEYLTECFKVIEKELVSQKEGNSPQKLNLPYINDQKIKLYRSVCMANDRTQFITLYLRKFLDLTQEELRVITNVGMDLISFEIVVPPELDNIIILDASHNIRKLVEFDKTISTAIPSDIDLVSYQNVTAYWMRRSSGRTSLTKQFNKRKDSRTIVKEYVHVIKELIPENEGVLIPTFKQRSKSDVDFTKIILDELESQGVDTAKRIKNPDGSTMPRIQVATWGSETSTNTYKFYSNIIFAGLLHRNPKELQSSIAGQMNNLLADVSHNIIREVQLSEVTHGVYQFSSRGSCRIYEGKETWPMKLWIHHDDSELRNYISKVMPELKWDSWKPVYQEALRDTNEIAKKIKSVLEALTGKTASSEVKKMGELQDIPNRTFQIARDKALQELTAWSFEGRSFIPC